MERRSKDGEDKWEGEKGCGRDEGEARKKIGRPSKAEVLGSERSWNVGGVREIEEFVKRKKIFKRSRKTERTPEKKEGLETVLKGLIEEIKEMRKEQRE